MRRTGSILLTLATASALALSACSAPPGADPGRDGKEPARSTARWDASFAKGAVAALPAGYLAEFDDCSQLLTYYQANALEMVTPFGIGGYGGYGGYGGGIEDAAGGPSGDAASAMGSDGSGPSGPEHSTTNVQEEGVDEPDVIKTDGRIIVTVARGKVRIVDVETEKALSTVKLPGRRDQAQPSEVLLHGSTLIVLSQEWGSARPENDTFLVFPPSRTIVTTVDLADPAAPRTIGSVRIEGSYRSARLVGDTVRLVMVTDPPGVVSTQPRSGSLQAEDEAAERNRELVRATTIDDWVPHRQQLDADGKVVSTDPLLSCEDISRPRDPSGLSTMSVLTFDIGSADPEPTSGTGLVATGSTVYASTDRLVVGTSGWDQWAWLPAGTDSSGPDGGPENRTDLHSFDISDPDETRYVASGTVAGRLINQWALDEEDGIIRVASTTEPPGASQASQSSLVVLREGAEELTEVGRVDGMGVTEQIQAVRYLSKDLAAVVTFRQTDPLYLVDTSDPTAPKIAGELKIPGYSAYLHPVGDGLLLGIGQDADPANGRTQGLQASLFDISDPSSPQRIDQLFWKNGSSPVEWDHRAFLLWPGTGQVVLPFNQWSEKPDATESDNFAGVTTFTVGETGLTEGDRVRTGPGTRQWSEPPHRTLVIGEDLWTADWEGLARFDLATLEGGWVLDLP